MSGSADPAAAVTGSNSGVRAGQVESAMPTAAPGVAARLASDLGPMERVQALRDGLRASSGHSG